MSPPATAPLLAGRYRLEEELCSAPFARVWRGTDVALNRPVAVRVLSDARGDAGARFLDKARLTGAVSHPGVTRVYDCDDSRTDSPPFLVTEYVDGSALTQLMADGPMGVTSVLDLIEQLAWALHAAHSAGLRHSAIKPSNVLVSRDGKVKLTDFGGKPEHPYLAPELADGSAPTVAGDLYALGMLARECLIGAEERVPETAALLVTLTEIIPGRRPADARTVAVRAGEMLRPYRPAPSPPPRAPLRLHTPHVHVPRVPHGHAVLPLAAVGAIILAFVLGRGFDPHPPPAHAARTVTVNAAALVGKPVPEVRGELLKIGLSVSVQWRASARLSPGQVMTVWPTGKVPAGSWVVVTGALREPATPGVVSDSSSAPPPPAAAPSPVRRRAHHTDRPASTPTATPSPTDSGTPTASPSPSASPSPASAPTGSPAASTFIAALPGSEMWTQEPKT